MKVKYSDITEAMVRRQKARERAGTTRIAKQLGVTPAGLSYLARLVARGEAPVRGNEVARLERDGLVAANPEHGFHNYKSRPWLLTDAGRDVVRRAREMGF